MLDPRFSDLVAGPLKPELFEKSYKPFLEELESADIKKLKDEMKALEKKGRRGQKKRKKMGLTDAASASSNGELLAERQAELRKLLSQRGERERAETDRDAVRAVKKRIRDKVASGESKEGYYLKKSEMKKEILAERFNILKKKGGDGAVKKAIEKRRKKNKNRDHKLMPTKR